MDRLVPILQIRSQEICGLSGLSPIPNKVTYTPCGLKLTLKYL